MRCEYAIIKAMELYPIHKATLEHAISHQLMEKVGRAKVGLRAEAIVVHALEYMLGIPKGDTHNWEDTIVEFWGGRYRTFGMTIQGIEANIPTPWHKKVRVERDG